MKNVAVIGCGSMGTALAVMLSKNGHNVKMWSRNVAQANLINTEHENKEYLPGIDTEGITVCTDKKEAVKDAGIVVCAVPSKAVRQVMSDFSKYLNKEQIIVNLAKGLEEGTLLRLSQVIKESVPQCKLMTLVGPCHAEEVANGIPSACVVTGEDMELASFIQNQFMNSSFRIYTNSDIVGTEIGAALKNVIALAAGINDGLGFGDNTKAALMTRGLAEIVRLGVKLGGKTETFLGLSGMGDLIVTCTSMHSRNRRAGILIGQGKSLEEALKEVHMVVEGVTTTKNIYELSLKYNVDMPITEEMYNVLFKGKNAREAVYDLMMRVGKSELA